MLKRALLGFASFYIWTQVISVSLLPTVLIISCLNQCTQFPGKFQKEINPSSVLEGPVSLHLVLSKSTLLSVLNCYPPLLSVLIGIVQAPAYPELFQMLLFSMQPGAAEEAAVWKRRQIIITCSVPASGYASSKLHDSVALVGACSELEHVCLENWQDARHRSADITEWGRKGSFYGSYAVQMIKKWTANLFYHQIMKKNHYC